MSNVSQKTTMVAVRLPKQLLERVDAADGSRTSVITAALERYLAPPLPIVDYDTKVTIQSCIARGWPLRRIVEQTGATRKMVMHVMMNGDGQTT